MTEPAPDVAAWLGRAGERMGAGDCAGAARIAGEGLQHHPGAAPLWNLLGVALVVGGRTAEGVEALEKAVALDPSDAECLRNLARLHISARAWPAARRACTQLQALHPGGAEPDYLLGVIAAGEGDLGEAERRFRAAVDREPRLVEAWFDLIGVARWRSLDEALAIAGTALAANPGDARLAAERQLLAEVAEAEAAVAASPGDRGPVRRRLELALQRLARETRPDHRPSPGRTEGLALQAAHDALIQALDAGVAGEDLPWVAPPVLMRLMAHDAMERLGGFETLGRRWAQAGDQRNFIMQLARAPATLQGRSELVAQHRLWAAQAEAAAARAPVEVPPRPRGERVRLGFKSSDLRGHAVAAFAWPLFEHLDRDRFEVYVYSFFKGPADPTQKAIEQRVTAYRHLPGVDAHTAAEAIAADGLDVLFELGGPTGANKAEVMAWRLAPVQASWLGYPHSLGLSTIDHVLVDPWLVPPDPSLLLERPLLMPRSWIVMGPHVFRDEPRPSEEPPCVANGFVTFGTANASYKYTRACLDAWARVLAAVPGSRFLFIRPEADAPSFRANARAAFAAHGVSVDRILFEPVRGAHLPVYDRLDVSLDTFPLTGGTTTCESLWMGVPVVSLVGEAMHERLSGSILTNAGLADLAVRDLDAYVATAAALAEDRPRLRDLRSGLRSRIRSGSLGDAAGFARDFYDTVAAAVSRAGEPMSDPADAQDEAIAAFERAAAADPRDPEPVRNLARIHAAAGDWLRLAEAAARLAERAPQGGDAPRLAAWAALHIGLARLEAGPRTGWRDHDEGPALQAVHDGAVACLDAGIPGEALPWTVPHVLMRLMARAALDRMGSFEALGRRFAMAGEHRVLLMQQARARPTREDRLELIEQHRLWGRWAEAAAAQAAPLPAGPGRGERIRLGFLSSDLRGHAVAAFASPLFAHPDPRFELYVYSFFPGPADAVQQDIAGRVQAYRHMPGASDDEAAAVIAADGLDVLIDLGGPTSWNRLRLMARRLAPVQASWLGYAHSAGLSTIDHILLDPHLVPPDPTLLIERPLTLPTSWIAMSGAYFRDEPAPAPEPPSRRNGYVTYGTANASYKYSPEGLDLWARVLAAEPGSRFMVVRPEAEARSFRAHFLAAFAARGVGPERVRFEPVRGAHLPFYGEMDVSLDTSPLTGGTTTCESLWMGVPVVSLVGEALYERLSASILTNAGLADLVTATPEDYVATAVALGRDTARLTDLRRTLRERLKASPLGQTERFAGDFYDLVAGLVR